MKHITLACVLLFLVSGCAPKGHWSLPPGVPMEKARRDAYDCQYMVNMQLKGVQYGDLMAPQMMHECLISRGFIWIPDEQRTNAQPVADSPKNNTSQTPHTKIISFSSLRSVDVKQIDNDDIKKLEIVILSYNTCNRDFIDSFAKAFGKKQQIVSNGKSTFFIKNEKWNRNDVVGNYITLLCIAATEKCLHNRVGTVELKNGDAVEASINMVTGEINVLTE